jgi:hypothetical protein
MRDPHPPPPRQGGWTGELLAGAVASISCYYLFIENNNRGYKIKNENFP